MSRLSLLMGLFMATAVTGIVLLLAVMGNVSSSTIISRSVVIFFIFGTLGTILGSFLEVLLMPITTEKETETLKKELVLEDAQLQAELGDLLDEDKGSNSRTETFGTPTDEPWPVAGKNSNSVNSRITSDGDSAAVS
jgi:hypothetical protein